MDVTREFLRLLRDTMTWGSSVPSGTNPREAHEKQKQQQPNPNLEHLAQNIGEVEGVCEDDVQDREGLPHEPLRLQTRKMIALRTVCVSAGRPLRTKKPKTRRKRTSNRMKTAWAAEPAAPQRKRKKHQDLEHFRHVRHLLGHPPRTAPSPWPRSRST